MENKNLAVVLQQDFSSSKYYFFFNDKFQYQRINYTFNRRVKMYIDIGDG